MNPLKHPVKNKLKKKKQQTEITSLLVYFKMWPILVFWVLNQTNISSAKYYL